MSKGKNNSRSNALVPFSDETSVIQINGLTTENRVDKVSVYGSIEFTRDRRGLELARNLKQIVDAVVGELEKLEGEGKLPESIKTEEPVLIKNPLVK